MAAHQASNGLRLRRSRRGAAIPDHEWDFHLYIAFDSARAISDDNDHRWPSRLPTYLYSEAGLGTSLGPPTLYLPIPAAVLRTADPLSGRCPNPGNDTCMQGGIWSTHEARTRRQHAHTKALAACARHTEALAAHAHGGSARTRRHSTHTQHSEREGSVGAHRTASAGQGVPDMYDTQLYNTQLS